MQSEISGDKWKGLSRQQTIYQLQYTDRTASVFAARLGITTNIQRICIVRNVSFGEREK